MRIGRPAVLLALVAFVLAALPIAGPPSVVRAAEYELETSATYDVRPADGEIVVRVDVEFTNTTPDPPGQFSVFDEVKLAVHDEAVAVEASDEDGSLDVSTEVEEGVNVATVELRDDLRFDESASFELVYRLPDSDDAQLRVRPSVVIFPAWSFGTSGEVTVTIPDAYEVRVDGDPLSVDGERLTSGPIEDPSRWLALVTALGAVEYTMVDATVPLAGGTADVRIRAFADDEAWGTELRDLLVVALPRLEDELGLPYPRIGQLVVTEAVATDASGFAEGGGAGGAEIMVAFDQPPFTALHQVSHVWLSPPFAESRWIREGLASAVAARVADGMDIERPFDPAAAAEDRAEAAFPLDSWSGDAGPAGEAYGYAASWAVIDRIEAQVGYATIRTALRRVAASVGPYQAASVEPEPSVEGVTAPTTPLTTRTFLDQLETVSGQELADLFADQVLTAEDAALLDERAAARREFERLAAAGGSWGTPDPVRGALAAWSFADAGRQMGEALAWLDRRDVLLEEMAAAGLSASDRLQQAYRAYGGGAEAVAQLDAHQAVVDAYAETARQVNAERSFVERIGLIGGPDPARELAKANGRFADGDLRGSVESIREAQRIVAAAETGGIVRLASAAVVIALLLVAAVFLFRRRASYTARP